MPQTWREWRGWPLAEHCGNTMRGHPRQRIEEIMAAEEPTTCYEARMIGEKVAEMVDAEFRNLVDDRRLLEVVAIESWRFLWRDDGKCTIINGDGEPLCGWFTDWRSAVAAIPEE